MSDEPTIPTEPVAGTPAADESSGPGFITGMLLGALFGASVAMILAPQSGEDTRDLLRAKAREAGDRARDAAGDLGDGVNANTSELLNRGRQIVEAARARLDDAVAEGKDAAADARTTLHDEL